MAEIGEIGIVKNEFDTSADHHEMRKHESSIIIKKELEEALFGIEENSHLQVLFHFHKSEGYDLTGPRYNGDIKGIFACRTPRRPGAIGLTTVELLERKENILRVKGLDAINGTPVLDIKPYTPVFDSLKQKEIEREKIKKQPRSEILPLLKTGDMETLLLKTGQFHGHYCPGVSMGVIAAVHGMKELCRFRSLSMADLQGAEGMEELLAILEVNSCLADGIQYVTGCTLGNNSLIYRDIGKTAVTLAVRRRSDPAAPAPGIRLVVRGTVREKIDAAAPDFFPLFDEVVERSNRDPELVKRFKTVSREASFSLVTVNPEEIFSAEEREIEIPSYAPIRDSVVCSSCGESVMEGKTAEQTGQTGKEGPRCVTCAGVPYYTLTGGGIRKEG